MTIRYHDLKTWPPYFQMILDGRKTFDLRVDDRGFREGDILLLNEYLPDQKRYTGRAVSCEVGLIVRGEWGLKEDVCAMSLLAVNSTVER